MSERSDLPIVEDVGAELHRLFLEEESRSLETGSEAESGRSPRGRWRSRPWIRGRVLLPLAGLLVAASAATAAVTRSAGSKPIRGAGYTACPPGKQIMASTKTRYVLPLNYPTRKGAGALTFHALRCFASVSQAVDAGYKLASSPRGFGRVGPIYFGKPNAFVQSTCERARAEMNAPVFCPGTLPAPWDDQSTSGAVTDAINCPGKGCEEPILSVNGAFIGPNTYVGSGTGIGEVSLWAISTAQESAPATIGLVGCPMAKLNTRTTFRGHPAGWYTCASTEDLVQTSSLLQWRVGDEHYGLMVSGPPGLRKRLTQYIAANLVEEQPSGTSTSTSTSTSRTADARSVGRQARRPTYHHSSGAKCTKVLPRCSVQS